MENLDIKSAKENVKAKKEADTTEAEKTTKAIREERNSMPYVSANSCNPIGAVVPTKVAYETIEALSVFTSKGIDTADYVKEKLGYSSRLDVCDAFASEQVDALALAIKQIENGKGFILGDMAGIGKGRVCAGLLRYARQQGKTPVFMTVKSTLFTDIYRDFTDIGGLDGLPSIQNSDLPRPFILNTDKESSVSQDNINEVITLFTPFNSEETKKLCIKKEMPKNKDIVLLTYSQLGMDIDNPKNANAIAKYRFLESIAPNSIFVLDESHIGASEGNSGKNLFALLSLVGGVMFASATYSKVPKSMKLYIPHTDIVKSKINPQTIVEAVIENGEAVQEYIASLLVKSGQMIRRERTYDKCKIEYNYIKSDISKYYKLYDNVMSLYNEIEEFSESALYKQAILKAKKRFVKEEENIILVSENDPKPSGRRSEEALTEWKKRNKKKYVLYFDPTKSIKNRFTWIENLLFSIKAHFVTQEVIKLLTDKTVVNERGEIVPNQVEYIIDEEKSFVNTNFKPIIAIRNTAESSIDSLGYKVGQRLSQEDNDYARTLVGIAKGLLTAKLKFVPVNESNKTICDTEAVMIGEDFEDGGVKYEEIINKMRTATTSIILDGEVVTPLPLSPIDYMIDTIEATERAKWDYEYCSKKTFKVEEVTKRSLSIKKVGEGSYEVLGIKKEKVTDKVARFNNGQSDVLILNTAGSTGISLHSSKKFFDKRPRVMMIHQVELDVNTEVQKRGRINRTGQVNNPAYTYVVSCIPSEIRKLLMLRRKLRSLDATTTGNVKQSAKASEIKDKSGNEIEDMSNKYGYECLQAFVKEDGNERFNNLVEEQYWSDSETVEQKFENYLREVEKLPCYDQQEFYDRMNSNYSAKKKQMLSNGDWDLETSIEDLKASTINKKIVFIGNNENEFTKSVYIEDKFVTPKGKPYILEELDDRILFLAKTKDYKKYHDKLVDDFDAYQENILAKLKESLGKPDTSRATSREEKEEIIEEHNDMVEDRIMKKRQELGAVEKPLAFFVPNKIVKIPIDSDLLVDGAFDRYGDRVPIVGKIGKFVGYKFLGKSENMYSPMNIELEFATTSRLKPHLKISLTSQYRNVLDWIMSFDGSEGNRFDGVEIAEARDWIMTRSSERDKMRVLTGEIFKAFEVSGNITRQDENYKTTKRLIKYTTTAGTVETGVKLVQKHFELLTANDQPLFAPINADLFKKMVFSLEDDDEYWLSSQTEFIVKEGSTYSLNICTGRDKVVSRGSLVPRKNIKSEYVSPLSAKEVIDDMKSASDTTFTRKEQTIYMEVGGASSRVNEMEFFVLKGNKDKISSLLDFLHERFSLVEEIKEVGREGQFVMRDRKETLIEGDVQTDEEVGEYEYYPLVRFNEDSTPPNYISGSFKEVPENPYGMVTLRYPLKVSESGNYKLVPVKITQAQAIKNILNSIDDDKKRLDYIEEVKRLKNDYVAIAQYTESVIHINPIYAVGNVTLKYAGKVISENISKPIEQRSVSVIEAEDINALEKIPLGWESAKDFIIKMKSI